MIIALSSITAIDDAAFSVVLTKDDGEPRAFEFKVESHRGITLVPSPPEFEAYVSMLAGCMRLVFEAVLAFHRAVRVTNPRGSNPMIIALRSLTALDDVSCFAVLTKDDGAPHRFAFQIEDPDNITRVTWSRELDDYVNTAGGDAAEIFKAVLAFHRALRTTILP